MADHNDESGSKMTIITTRFMKLGSALLLALCASGANAAGYAGTQFEIEMVVFSRDNGMSQSRETWPAAPRLNYGSRWVDFQTPSVNDPALPALQPVPNQLDNKVAALRRSSGYQVLFHKTWRQVLQNERRAPQIMINGGPTFGEHHALEGSVTLSVSRYLHLSADLWFSEFANAPQSTMGEATTAGILVPLQPKTTAQPSGEPVELSSGGSFGYSNADGSYSTSADSASFGPASRANRAAPAYAAKVAVLKEERRLRSGELHYIDHPKLGVLIEVRTVKAQPEDPADDGGEESLSLPTQN